MSNKSTLDPFLEPLTPEQQAREKAMAEIREEDGRLRNSLQKQIRDLRRQKGRENKPLARASLEQQIATKEQDIKDLEWAFFNATTAQELALQKRVRDLMNWDEIMKKHLGNIPTPTTPVVPATPATPPTGQAS